MSEGPDVRVETDDGRTEIEVESPEAASLVKGFLSTLDDVVADAERIYVEIDEERERPSEEPPEPTDAEEVPADTVEQPDVEIGAEDVFNDTGVDTEVEAPGEEAFDGGTINEGTSNHAVASVLRKHGPMVVNDIAERIDDYPKSTVSSTLTYLKDDHIVAKESPNGGPNKWELTDYGYDVIGGMKSYDEVEA